MPGRPAEPKAWFVTWDADRSVKPEVGVELFLVVSGLEMVLTTNRVFVKER